LCKIVYQGNSTEVTFVGAKTTLYYASVHNNKLIKLSGDRKPIGGIQITNKSFTNQVVELPTGSMLFLSTDGIVDQNNPERKKFGSVRFEALLEENIPLVPLEQQKRILENALDGFMQKVEQRDDITVLGIRL
jgi:serine phosphatase RsbU (regulator of sigma subunit)